MIRYPIPAEETRAEIRVSNSRFIATLAPAFSVEEARAFIARIKEEFSDATHNVTAFVVGHGASVTAHSNDDGEPSGCAGRPALAMLQGSGLGDAVVVVTRYFGGTKLGTGRLVRAYGDAVRSVVEITPRAEKMSTHLAMIALPYNYYERVRRLVLAHNGIIRDEDFTADVTLGCEFACEGFPAFQAALEELSHGQFEAEIVATNEAAIMPLGTQTGSLSTTARAITTL
ncbi:MAG: YigZ family protein [Chloroflexi bacterium]|nr:YigZ family protein [Chloroflexota bacterium]